MKKSLSILLSVLILVFSCGISFAVSYCPMSEELKVSLSEDKSCCCKDANEDDCCKDTQIKIEKIKDNYLPSGNSEIPAKKCVQIPSIELHSAITEVTASSNEVFFWQAKAPPGIYSSRNIFFRVLII